MSTNPMKLLLQTVLTASALLGTTLAIAATTVNMTARQSTVTMPNGVTVPMWQYCGAAVAGGTGSTTGGACTTTAWAPGPTIRVTVGETLTVNLTNNLPVPTSLIVLGQLGGGLGVPTRMPLLTHTPQAFTTFPGNTGTAGTPKFIPPQNQAARVQSMGTEVVANTGPTALTYTALKPGTYIYETGTMPSLQVPMGLYGLLIVTAPPVTVNDPITNAVTAVTTPGSAYLDAAGLPTVPYDADAALLFSEIDPVMNAQIEKASKAGTDMTKNMRFNDSACGANCYPAAVNYTPTYFMVNGQSFDRTAPQLSSFNIPAAENSGNVLVRIANAGLRTHIPSIVGLQMSLVGEDGHLAPGLPKVQSEALLTAGKTYDAIVHPAFTPATTGTTPTPAAYTGATIALFDRQGSLTTANQPDGGMQAFLVVAGGTGGVPPSAASAVAMPDAYSLPAGGSLTFDVRLNDIAVKAAVASYSGPGTLVQNLDGTFTYTAPATGTGVSDSFTYTGNGGTNGPVTNSAVVTLTVGSPAGAPKAMSYSYCAAGASCTSVPANLPLVNIATQFSVGGPGVLTAATDPASLKVSVDTGTATNNCGTGSQINADGSFTAVRNGTAPCVFTYKVKNSQGTLSAASYTATVNFPAQGSGLVLSVLDAASAATPTPTALTDYRWTIQEDLTFKHDTTKTPLLSTRTVGTSFHRSHNVLVATGCWHDPSDANPSASCGAGQQSRSVPLGTKTAVNVGDVVLDPTKHYYVSVLPGDAQNPVKNAGGAPVTLTTDPITGAVTSARAFKVPDDCGAINDPKDPCGHIMGGVEIGPKELTAAVKAATIKVQRTPLVPAQLSLFIYNDNLPANGQIDANEVGLGGFNIIILDPAGRSGDPAGQQTYDSFNMPLTNALLGQPGCPDDQNTSTNGSAASAAGNLVGVIYTCPNDPNDGTAKADPVKYALAGHALVKNITPARYDVIAHPGAEREGKGEIWWQTETLEGTPAQDAFAGINESVYFQEFGPPGFHTTIGFVQPMPSDPKVAGATITGEVTSKHMTRPSQTALYDAGSYDLLSSTSCRAALNSQGGTGPTVQVVECDTAPGLDGALHATYAFKNVPAGDYEVQIFDNWLDQIIQAEAVTVKPADVGGTVGMAHRPVFSWFTQHDQNLLLDGDGTGAHLTGIPNALMSVRYRNGSMSNQTLTDVNGNGILVELFPLFNWYVSESDTTHFKQKQVNITVDGGGPVDTSGPGAHLWSSHYPSPNGLTDTSVTSVRTETPGATTYGVQSFISERNQINWVRTPYAPNENGGIQGHVVLSSTRPYDDQRFDLQTIWEPLVPRVNMNLYRRVLNADGTETLSLVDSTTTSSFDDWVNTVVGMVNGAPNGHNYILGPDGSLRDVVTGALAASSVTAGAQVNMSCPGQLPGPAAGALPPYDMTKVDPFTNYTLLGDVNRCYDGFHNWNQVQPAPYDGRYQFPSAAYVAAHPLTAAQAAAHQTLVSLPPGDYVVEAVTPPGYEIVKEEDKNILIGDAFIAPVVQQFGGLGNIFILPDQATLNNANPNNPTTGDTGFQSNPTSNLGVLASRGLGSARQPESECVGALHRVPDFLSLYPQAQQVAPFAGMDKPLCDRKLLKLGNQMQTGADFFVFTETPAAANATGIILDDASAEFNAASPDFGEKASVPFIPVSTKDFAGNEISRTYSDQWGAYNLMLPSSWLVNPPTPSGYGPNMLVNCINDPGPIDDPSGKIDPTTGKVQKITDPAYNPAYSNFCYTNPFMPGQATYLDTPVLPIAAFAQGYNPADCAYPNLTPAISRVDAVDGATTPGAGNFGPYVPLAGGTLTIKSLGDQSVQNPDYAGPFATSGLASTRSITRHYGFGAAQGEQGRVRMILSDGTAVNLPVVSWSDLSITVTVPAIPVTVPATVSRSGQLEVRAAGGRTTIDAVTVTQEDRTPVRVQASAGGTIQAAIDGANPGDLVLVDAGHYNELVVMWKPVRLQGVGASSVIINAAKYPTSKLAVWRPEIDRLFGVDAVSGNGVTNPQVDPLPSQTVTGGIVLLEPTVLGSEEGAGITVLAKNPDNAACGSAATSSYYDPTVLNGASGTIVNTTLPMSLSNFNCAPSRIDGVAVTGGDAGGGIFVNGWAHGLEISNNRVYGNAGAYNGGIRIGVPYLEDEAYPGQTQDANGNLVGSPTLSFDNKLVGFGYDKNVKIHNNAVTKNGTVEAPLGGGGAGGGVSICSGTDGYLVDANWICGNYSSADGGGIGHIGFSQGGVISNNNVLFNQSFQQTSSTHGGGIAIEGEPPIAGTLTLGTGNVMVRNNVIHGNFAEVGHGGGIRLQQVNGAEVAAFPATGNNAAAQKSRWFQVTMQGNTIESNVSGWSGAGVSLSDALVTRMTSNSIRSNDSTGIAGPLLGGGTLPSTTTAVGTGIPNAAGVSSELTSAPLAAAVAATAQLTATQKAISSPTLTGGTVAYNRSFFYRSVATGPTLCSSNNIADASGGGCTTLNDQTTFGQCANTTAGAPAYWDFGVVGDNSAVPGIYALAPTGVTLTPSDTAYAAGNTLTAPAVTLCNGARSDPRLASVINPPSPKNLQVAATIDEGNNYVSLRYGPLTLTAPVIPPSGGLSPGAGDPLSFDFGNQQVGSGLPVVFTFTNGSPTAVTLRSNGAGGFTNITGTNAGNFVRSTPAGSTCAGGVAVAAGASCTFTVTFTPSALGLRGPATLNVFITGPGTPLVSEQLFGTGVAPAGTLAPGAGSPPAYDFGGQQVGVDLPVVFTFTNSGTGSVQLRTNGNGGFTNITGANAGNFVRSTPAGSTCAGGVIVTAGASCTFTVTFTPSQAGSRGPATLNVFITGPGTPLVSETLTGTGVAAAGTFSPSPLAFGNQTRNTTSVAKQVTFTNTTGAPLTFRTNNPVTTTGNFAISANACTGTIATGASCVIGVTFTPSGLGARSGTLNIFAPGGGGAFATEGLTGTGT